MCWPDGHHIVPDPVKGIRSEFCLKWPTWVIRERLIRFNVPPHLTEPDFALVPERVQQEFSYTRRDRLPRWYYITGGDPRRHESLLVPMLYDLAEIMGRTCWFDVTASVFRKSLEYQRNTELSDPLDRIRDTHTLALNIVNPTVWKDWFQDGMDEALYSRSGKTTVIAHAKSAEELGKILPLSAGLLQDAIQVELQ